MTTDHEASGHVKQRFNLYCAKVVIFISLSSAAYGYAAAIIATTLTQPSFTRYMHLETAHNGASLTGAMMGLNFAGGIVGSGFAAWVSKRFGRKWSVANGLALILVSGALLTASVNAPMFIVFRFLQWMGPSRCFQVLASVPLWVAELAPPHVRGILVDIHAVFMLLGYNIAAYVGLGFYFVPGQNQWRGPVGIQMILPAIVLCGIYFMPESPRFLVSKGRLSEGWEIVRKLHHEASDPEDRLAKRTYFQMEKQIEFDATLPDSYWHIIKTPSLRKRVLMTILLEFCIQSSGILVVLNYGSTIWESLGFNTVQILNFQGGFQLISTTGGLLAMLFVDRVARPKLIGFGLLTCATVMAILTGLQATYVGSTNRSGLIACGAMILLFSGLFSLLVEGAVFFYVAEIWPTHLRPQGFAIAISTLCATDLIWLQCAPVAFDSIGWKYFLCFVTVPAVGACLILWTFPDTLHKPLEEIAAMFGDNDLVVVYQRDLDSTDISSSELVHVDPSQQDRTTGKEVDIQQLESV